MNEDKRRVTVAIILTACCAAASLGLAIAKLYVGLRGNSLVVMLDGMNSFFDVATTVVAVVAFALVLAPRTERHPYGMGRSEYLAGFVVAAVTVVMGGVYLLRALNRLAMPEPVYYRSSGFLILSLAMAVKIGMAVAYGLINRRVRSHALRALMWDSLMDVGITAVSLASYVISQRLSYAVDAWLGLACSGIAIGVGVKLVVDNVRVLVGGTAAAEARRMVEETLLREEGVCAVPAVELSDYGYHRLVGYAEVVFASDVSLVDVLAFARRIETSLLAEGITLRVVPRSSEGVD